MRVPFSPIYRLVMISLLLLCVQARSYAQAAGSQEVIEGYMAVAAGCTHASAGESLYIGPGTYVVNGTWQIYSKNIWISPAAIISGTGAIKLYNPSAAGGTASTSLLDGNNSPNFLNVNLVLANASGLTLTNSSLTSGFTSGGWVDSSGTASLSNGKDFNFNVSGAYVYAASHDMTLGSAATLSGYQQDRFVVTAGTGHLVKQGYTGAFVFPVGMAAGDYTPAQINNVIANSFHVNVTDYNGVNSATFSTAITMPQEGIYRGWNIYAGNAAGNSTIDLQHNTGTNGTAYSNNVSFVTRLVGAMPNTAGDNTSHSYWESNTQGAGSASGTLTTGAAIATASERSRTYTSFATGAGAYTSWFTKSSEPLSPLPVTLSSFSSQVATCGLVKLRWTVEQEQNVQGYEIQQSQGNGPFAAIGFLKAAGPGMRKEYSFVAAQSPGQDYYRLKMINTDGSAAIGSVLPVTMNCVFGNNRAYPVPFKTVLTIVTGEEVKSVQVLDVLGRVIIAEGANNGSRTQSFDATAWPPGAYLLRLIKKDATIVTIKAIKN